jgi:hypothetical protein
MRNSSDSRGVLIVLFVLLAGCPSLGDPGAPARPQEVTGDWWSRVSRQLQLAEYEITWQEETVLADLGSSWQAPNRAQGLRTYFAQEDIRVVPRGEASPSWELVLRWARYGRPSDSIFVVPDEAERLPDGNRIDYIRGPLTEWYVNDPRGLKQGFLLTLPPESVDVVSNGEGRAGSGPLAIDLALEGGSNPVFSRNGQAVEFFSPRGVLLARYDALDVYDAQHRRLAAHLEGFNDDGLRGVRIVIDDAGAVYPLTVDPILTTSSWTFEGELQSDHFGFSVSTAGDVNGDGYNDVIVGVPLANPGIVNAGRV